VPFRTLNIVCPTIMERSSFSGAITMFLPS
jgi:hypothetical protein